MGNSQSTSPPLPHDVIYNNNTVRVLINKKISEKDAIALSNELKYSKATDLYMHSTRFDNLKQSLEYLLSDRGILNSRTITTLDLSNTAIDDYTVTYLARYLKGNDVLTTLFLNDNRITDRGAKFLLTALERNTSLQVLQMKRNYITDPKLYHSILTIDTRPAMQFNTANVDHTIAILQPSISSTSIGKNNNNNNNNMSQHTDNNNNNNSSNNLSLRNDGNDVSSSSIGNNSSTKFASPKQNVVDNNTPLTPLIIIANSSNGPVTVNELHTPSVVRPRSRSRAGSQIDTSKFPTSTSTLSPQQNASSRVAGVGITNNYQNTASPHLPSKKLTQQHQQPVVTPMMRQTSNLSNTHNTKSPAAAAMPSKQPSPHDTSGNQTGDDDSYDDDDDEEWYLNETEFYHVEGDEDDEDGEEYDDYIDPTAGTNIDYYAFDHSASSYEGKRPKKRSLALGGNDNFQQAPRTTTPPTTPFNLLNCIQMDYEYFGGVQLAPDVDVEREIRNSQDFYYQQQQHQEQQNNNNSSAGHIDGFDSDDAEILPTAPKLSPKDDNTTSDKMSNVKGGTKKNKVLKKKPKTTTNTNTSQEQHQMQDNIEQSIDGQKQQQYKKIHKQEHQHEQQQQQQQPVDNNGTLTSLIQTCLIENKLATNTTMQVAQTEALADFHTFGKACKLYRKNEITIDRYGQILLYHFSFAQLCFLLPRLIAVLFEYEHPQYQPPGGTWFSSPALINKMDILANNYTTLNDFELFTLAIECCTVPLTICHTVSGKRKLARRHNNPDFVDDYDTINYRLLQEYNKYHENNNQNKNKSVNNNNTDKENNILSYIIWQSETRSYQLYQWFLQVGCDVVKCKRLDVFNRFFTLPDDVIFTTDDKKSTKSTTGSGSVNKIQKEQEQSLSSSDVPQRINNTNNNTISSSSSSSSSSFGTFDNNNGGITIDLKTLPPVDENEGNSFINNTQNTTKTSLPTCIPPNNNGIDFPLPSANNTNDNDDEGYSVQPIQIPTPKPLSISTSIANQNNKFHNDNNNNTDDDGFYTTGFKTTTSNLDVPIPDLNTSSILTTSTPQQQYSYNNTHQPGTSPGFGSDVPRTMRSSSILSPRAMSFKTLRGADLQKLLSQSRPSTSNNNNNSTTTTTTNNNSNVTSPFAPTTGNIKDNDNQNQNVKTPSHTSPFVPQQNNTNNSNTTTPQQRSSFRRDESIGPLNRSSIPSGGLRTPRPTMQFSQATLTRKQSITNQLESSQLLSVEKWVLLARQPTAAVKVDNVAAAAATETTQQLRAHPRISTLLLHIHLVFPNPYTIDGRYPFIDGLPPEPTQAQIEKVYRRLCVCIHPDKLANKAPQVIELGTKVFAVVSNAFARYRARHESSKQKKTNNTMTSNTDNNNNNTQQNKEGHEHQEKQTTSNKPVAPVVADLDNMD